MHGAGVGHTFAQALEAGPGDHRRIVGAQRHRRRDEGEAVPRAKRFQRAADFGIGRDAAGHHQRRLCDVGEFAAEAGEAAADAVVQRVGDRRLEGGADVGDVPFAERRDRGRRLPHRRLQAGEGKIQPRLALQRAREIEAPGVAVQRCLLDVRAAGIGQADQLRRLVERLAERIVDGRAPALVVADAAHQHDLRMPAGNQQQQIREMPARR